MGSEHEKAMVVSEEKGLIASTFLTNEDRKMWWLAQKLVNSNLCPKDCSKVEDAFIRMQYGACFKMDPMRAVQRIAVINGRPGLWGDDIPGICKASPDFEDAREYFTGTPYTDEYTAVCEVKRKGQQPVRQQFSVADAKLAGKWKQSGPWTTYPRRMLQMRARSFAYRDAFPDALQGFYSKEELEDSVDVEYREVPHTTSTEGEREQARIACYAARDTHKMNPKHFANWVSSRFAGRGLEVLTLSELYQIPGMLDSEKGRFEPETTPADADPVPDPQPDPQPSEPDVPPQESPSMGELKAACQEARKGTDLASGAAYGSWLKKHFGGRGSTELTADELARIPEMIRTRQSETTTTETPAHTARAIQIFGDYCITGGQEMDDCIAAMYGDGRTLANLDPQDVSMLPLKLKKAGAKPKSDSSDPDPEA